MVDVTDLDRRLANHAALVGRVNEYGWMRAASGPTRGPLTQGMSTVVSPIRQRVGLALVRAGERLRGTPASHTVDPTAAV